MIDEAALLDVLIDEMPTQPVCKYGGGGSRWNSFDTMLECTVQGCSHGEGGTRWKTPALPIPDWAAIKLLGCHNDAVHGQHVGGGGDVVDDTEHEMLSQVGESSLIGQSGGQEEGAQQKIIPKTVAYCEVVSFQFTIELDDEVSPKRVVDNHMFVADREKEQHHQQELCGRKGGRRGGAKKKSVPDNEDTGGWRTS